MPSTNAEHILSSTNANAEKAELLSLAERDVLFVIQRRTWSKENLETYVRLFLSGTILSNADYFIMKERFVFQRKSFVKVRRFSCERLFPWIPTFEGIQG